MDPLTAFSLACGVIQVVDFSIKVLAKCKEVHDHGALSEHQEIEEITKYLTNLRIDTSASQSSGTAQTSDDRELRELSKTCSATAEQLVAKLQTLKIEGPHKKRQALVKTVKARWERRELHDIEKKLNSYRGVLDTKILVNLRHRSDLASFQQSHDFQTLDQGIQMLIVSLAEGPKSFEELRTVIRKENEETREHISKVFQQQQKQLEREEYRKRLLDSLWFAEIHSREENIAEAHRKTFEWIFDVSDHAMGPWDNFIQWLEKGQDTYWINGKAGSGKSTLMSLLCQDNRTLKSLRCWSGNRRKNVLMPKFYFWSGGTQMQKSIEGLLRSLIFQVLQLLPDLDITSSAFESRHMIPAWTERRLQTTLQDILQRSSGSHLFCLFIDGLDEYEGDQGNLIDFILELVKSSDVKVCLSSRPDRVFDQAFGLSAKLRLQDLTHSDIQKFVVDRFEGMPQVHSIAIQRSGWLDFVTRNILARADGVFLWVTLAVKDQIRGLENGDSLEQLEERLESLPDEVEGIYARMLGQIEKVYRKEASMLLQIALDGRFRSLLDFVLASQDRLENMLSSPNPLPERELNAKSHTVRQRIATTCAGLLEVNDKHEGESNQSDDASSIRYPESIQFQGEATDDEIFDLESKVTIGFIHRTARDFMQDSAQGGILLKANTPSDFHLQISYVKVLLAKLRLFGSNNADLNVNFIMHEIQSPEDQIGVAQIQLCQLVDDVMSRIDRICGPWPRNIHWSLRWADERWRSMHKELLIPGSKGSCPSSSDDSFHSMSCQPDTPNEVRKALTKKPDILAFAVYHGLRRYVQQVIHDRKEPLDADTVNYLLYCAVHLLKNGWSGLRADDVNFIHELLRQGGNPNLKDSSLTMTTWSTFLVEMHHIMPERWENEIPRAFFQTTVSFVENGADLHSILAIPSSRLISNRVHYSFDLSLSALAIIELSLNNQLEYPHLKDLCAGKGAPYYSLCTQITRDPLRNRKERITLSDSESTDFLEIYNKYLANESSRGNWNYEIAIHIEKRFQDRFEDVSESE